MLFRSMKPALVVFDLDHTLLAGDSDVLWCDFLMNEGVLDRDSFAMRNAQMEADYKAGSVDAQAFASFYVSTLAGRSPAQWQPLRERFLHEVIAPRIPADAHALVRSHQAAGDTVVMTTATNRFITELGLTLEGRATIEGEWAARVSGLGNQRVEIAMLRTPDGHGRLELSRFDAPAIASRYGAHRAMNAASRWARPSWFDAPIAACRNGSTCSRTCASGCNDRA